MGVDHLRAVPAPDAECFAGQRPRWTAGISVLILDAEPAMRSFMQRGLGRHCALVESAADRSEAEDLLSRCHFDVLIADIGSFGREGFAWVEGLRDQGGSPDVIFVSAKADPHTAIAALRAGACDYIIKPFRIEQLLAAARHGAERRGARRENVLLERDVDQYQPVGGLVGDGPSMREVCRIIERIAPMPSVVLIEGESGTGKELAARAIHTRSERAGPFVAINCGAVSPELLESELFGHVKGAFTGAHQAREGLFSFAHGGSLFLDEIGEMPFGMQANLLRVLEEKAVRPVGGNAQVPVDVRIISATNRNLSEEVAAGRFREDLFYRLNVVALRLPPLRERHEDVLTLARHFLGQLSTELGIPAPEWDGWDLDQLCRYHWPGNVRELRNVIERCLLLGDRPGRCIGEFPTGAHEARDGEPDLSLAAVEQAHILRVLGVSAGNKSEAARRLGISRKTLERKLKAWGAMDEPAVE